MTRVTAPEDRPISSDSRPAVAAPVSSSTSIASTSDSDRPKRIATVCPKNEPWRFTRRRDRMTESMVSRFMVDTAPRRGSLSARCRYCTKMLNGATASREPSYDTEGEGDGTATADQRPDDRDAQPPEDVHVAQVHGRSGPRRGP